MLVSQSKKTDCNTKVSEIESKISTDHDQKKYITKHVLVKNELNELSKKLKQYQQMD